MSRWYSAHSQARRGGTWPNWSWRQLDTAMRTNYARALYEDPGATLADLREAVTTLEDTERIARRTLGGAHPLAAGLSGHFLRKARAALRARETPSGEA